MHLPDGSVVVTDDICFAPGLGYGINEAFLKVFILSYTRFLQDSPHDPHKPSKVMRLFLKTLTKRHLKEVIVEFSNLADELLSNEYVTGSESSTGLFIDRFKDTPIFREYLAWFRTRDPIILKYILSFLYFGKKLRYIDSDLDSIAFRGWKEVEDKLSTLQFSKRDIDSLSNIISAILPPLSPDALLPRFGTGKVSERGVLDVYDKLSSLSFDRKVAYTFLRPAFGSHVGLDYHSKWIKSICKSEFSSTARLKFVPKTIKTSRSICMEPNGYMYFQQEVLRWLRSSMDKGLISRFVNLEDQSLNRQAAIHGSIYLSSDTIDLSSASDSVHVDLVRGVFPAKTLFYLLGSRSKETLTPEGKRTLYKFAPMGSALCFPVQCILFTAISLYGYILSDRGGDDGQFIPTVDDVRSFVNRRLFRTRSARTPFDKVRYEPPVIYGDDIICDSRCNDVVVDLLSRLGFSVNVSKSFTGSQSLRESCGVYAFEGSDVTPVIFRLPFFNKGNFDAKVYTSIIEGINTARDNGYHSIAAFWLSILKDYGFKWPLPFTSDRLGFGLYTSNKHVVRPEYLKWNPDEQVHYEIVTGIEPIPSRKKVPESLDAYRLVQWWRSRISGCTTSSFGRSLLIRPQETRVASRWTRCEQ